MPFKKGTPAWNKGLAMSTKPKPVPIGQVFGNLTVVGIGEPLVRRKGRKETRWLCLCSCGNYKHALPNTLKCGTVKSCGCLWGRQSVIPDAAINQLFYNYGYHATKRGKEFTITKEEFRTITSGNCHYCGAHPLRKWRVASKKTQSYICNGIDRVDNDRGYILDNCVPCCWTCNQMKKNLSIYSFIDHISKILAKHCPAHS